ncbi:MAG: penicillin-binding transpeptidase domain-containing protein, partial [Desulfobulbaceae bacterium]|nr:penicillin-binding transpeptidase domain-containing protein [Desulfobulbaceae bacterium]
LVTRKGMVKAMVGGMENRYFNRAIEAKRSMGSIFKPFLFGAALQLGWNSTDLLDNNRNIFIFQGSPYFPRPDHQSRYKNVSMAWAGVHSENVAAVWLLCHLVDHLSPSQLRDIAKELDLAPRSNERHTESYEHFKTRIRDNYGIIIDNNALQRAAYDQTVATLEADFLFDRKVEQYEKLKQTYYGLDFDKFAEKIEQQLEEEEITDKQRDELLLRKSILANNFLSLNHTLKLFDAHRQYYNAMLNQNKQDQGNETDNTPPLPQNGFFYLGPDQHIIFSLDPPGPEHGKDLLSPLDIYLQLQGLPQKDHRKFWQSVLLNGNLDVYTVHQVARQLPFELKKLNSLQPYSMEVLCQAREYLIMVGLQYLRALGKETGILSKLDPVLSFPLGSNVISLHEAVGMYESLITGNHYDVSRSNTASSTENEEISLALSIIKRIESAEGKVIYSANVSEKKIFEDKNRNELIDILAHVVTHGTGRYAKQKVRLNSTDPNRQQQLKALNLPLPLLGKTGTANNFINAAFVGFTPTLSPTNEPIMQTDNGYTVGVYVGFDDNRPMEQNSTHLTGATGALPAWCNIVESILSVEQTGNRIDLVDLSFDGLTLAHKDTGYILAPTDPTQGGVYRPTNYFTKKKAVSILTHGQITDDNLETDHLVKPFWNISPTKTRLSP